MLAGIIILAMEEPATGQAQSSAQVNVRWESPRQVLLGPEGELHAGERLTISAEGQVCRAHFHRVEDHGWWIFSETVVIDRDNWVRPSELPPLLQLQDAAGTPLAQVFVPGGPVTLEVVASAADGVRTLAHPFAFVRDLSGEERGISHGEYTLRVTVEGSGRLELLRQNLTARRHRYHEIVDPHFFDNRTQRQYPEQLAQLLLDHVNRYYAQERDRGDPAVDAFLREALRLDPTNVVAMTAMGTNFLRRGAYAQAGPQLSRAVEDARRRRDQDPSNANQMQFGDAAAALAGYFTNITEGVWADDLARADVLLGEAAEAYAIAGETIRLRDVLVRRARVLTRVRTRESLATAITLLDHARRLAPEPVDP